MEQKKTDRVETQYLPKFYQSALDKLVQKHYLEISNSVDLEKELNKTLKKNNAIRLFEKDKKEKLTQKLKEETNIFKKEERQKIAKELAGSKAKLRTLRSEVAKKEIELEDLKSRCKCLTVALNSISNQNGWPNIPEPNLIPNKDGYPELLNVPGIYFIWSDGIIAYVGQSLSLGNRLKFGSHHQLKNKSELISVIQMDRKLLTWAENYYIGIIKPMRNYGKRGHHNS